jgi:hypothetical protein
LVITLFLRHINLSNFSQRRGVYPGATGASAKL